MSEGFTPGPWAVSEDERPGMEWNRHIVLAGDPDLRIAFMTSDGPTEANARLIAAAPQMFEALKELVEDYADLCATIGYREEEIAEIKVARAALAAARGG